jgi:ParB family transcriptional regulator, chromosome partitioning protein
VNVELIELSKIVEDPDQPRRHLDDEALQGLADSIRSHGVLQPLTVRSLPNVNMYRIVTGERRWRAAQMAGLEEVPCILTDTDGDDALTWQLVENLQREDLQPLEKARAVARVKDAIGSTNREIAGRLGISERAVGYLLDLLTLPSEIGEQVVSSPNRPAEGQITEKHARYLKQLGDDPELQSAVVEKIRDERMTGDQTGRLVKALKGNRDDSAKILSSPADHLSDWFRGTEKGGEDEPDFVPPPAAPSAQAEARVEWILGFLVSLEHVHPMEMPHSEVRAVADALTSLKLAVDGLLRECRLELGEKVG